MSSLTVAWEYLTGYTVATDPASRQRAEWPPHPARVYMAMAAAWFETEPRGQGSEASRRDHAAEGNALRWLESLAEPELWLPSAASVNERSLVTVYVPVNDRAGPSPATLQSAPALTRTRQGRTFPRLHVGDLPCALRWPEAPDVEAHHDGLSRLCAKVTRIGHSSSLVRMWVADAESDADVSRLERWRPAEDIPTVHCRRIAPGLLDGLPSQTQIPRIEAFADMVWRIEDAQRAVSEAKKGADSSARKAAKHRLEHARRSYEQEFGEAFRKSAAPPPRLRPQIGLWTGYRRALADEPRPGVAASHFDTDLLILAHTGGPRLPLTATLAGCSALRALIMKRSGTQPVPSWVSGHQADGTPNEEDAGHLAVVPLPFVGRQHADGHLLGLGLAFPRSVARSERGRVLGPLLVNHRGEPTDVTLLLGALGEWMLRKGDWSDRRQTLRPETWTAGAGGSVAWASVTPVVLDKFPKSDRSEPSQRAGWEQEVRGIISGSCMRIGLPRPIHIDVDTTSWHLGSPRARSKGRPLRVSGAQRHAEARAGNGFPAYPAKGTNAPRPQVHVFLQFAEPVCGPVLLGAGRYRGYGLLKPWPSR